MSKIVLTILSFLAIVSLPMAFADFEEKLEFGSELQETLGHFWALEQNLDGNNAELAIVHATHPIAELYGSMSEKLADNPEFDSKLQQTLLDLQHKANTEVTREEAQKAIDEAKTVVAEAQNIVIGDLANDDAFKAQLANILLETSKVEYAEAVNDGIIEEMAEFQDGSAFVWRAKELLATMNIESAIADIVLNNNDSRPACVTESGADKLASLGWGTRA